MTTLAPELGPDMNADLRTLWFADSLAEIHISTRDGDGAATLIELTLPEGHMTPLHVHDEDGSHYVLDGRVTFFVGDDVVEVERGSTVLAPRGIPHTFRVDSPGARMLVTGARFEEFVRAASRPADLPVLPHVDGPPTPEQAAAFTGAAAENGIEILGPPGMLPADL